MRTPVRRTAIVATLFFLALLPRAGADVPMVEISVTGPDGTPVARGLVLLYRPVSKAEYYAADRGKPPKDQARLPEDRAGIREGRAFLSLPGPGTWRVVATAPDLAPSDETLDWAPGFPAPRLALCLGAGGTIEGEARAANGRRLVGARDPGP